MMLVELKMIGKTEFAVVTSLDIADTFEKQHRRVLQDIRELNCSDNFRLHEFVQSEYINAQGHKQPMYLITRDGFSLLVMGYTGDKAMKFKENYIKQFNAMERALIGKAKERAKGIAVRQSLTDVIKNSKENERLHGHAYSLYTDVIYKNIIGKTAKQIRAENGLSKKDILRDYFSEEELNKISTMERAVGSLVELGWGYDKVKRFVQNESNNMNLIK